jgi:hypothetical protein
VEVGLRPEAVVDAAVEAMLRAGYRLENRAENTVTFARYRGVEVACIGCLLMLLLLLPGLLYLIFAQKTARLTIAAHPIEGGSRLVIGGGSPEGVRMAAQWARGLPRPDEVPLPELSEPPTTGPQGLASPREAPDVPEQIGRLAELRDAGLITPEEFEAKKPELLGRM